MNERELWLTGRPKTVASESRPAGVMLGGNAGVIGVELDERQLLEDLGDLASISSVEQLHEADLPELRRVAHELGDHPDDRTGRYAAIRDAITLAIDRIEDTAFADAAEALLGYNDRWRSVRDRGTDAGRAFTPTISYDAFRRKSGRNYRTNTLRMVADELQAALAGAPASPVDPEEPTTTNTVPDRSQINTPTAGSAAREPSGRMRRLMGVGLLGVLGGLIAVGVLLFGRGDPADQRASTVERTPASAASTTTVSPAATNAAITKSPPPTEQATPTVEEPTPEPEPAPTHAVGEVDVTRHCRGANDPEQDFYGVRTEDVEGGWACRSADGSLQRAPSISDACREQYGPSALPREDGGWACQIAFVDLVVPNNSTKNVGCAVPVGAYDRRALEVFERYSTRFVEAFGAADLPDTVCADGTMHLYGDPADTGITQLLVDGESSYGAPARRRPAERGCPDRGSLGRVWRHTRIGPIPIRHRPSRGSGGISAWTGPTRGWGLEDRPHWRRRTGERFKRRSVRLASDDRAGAVGGARRQRGLSRNAAAFTVDRFERFK